MIVIIRRRDIIESLHLLTVAIAQHYTLTFRKIFLRKIILKNKNWPYLHIIESKIQDILLNTYKKHYGIQSLPKIIVNMV